MKDGWHAKRLGDVATLQRGFDLPTRNRVSGEFPIVSSSGIIDTHNEGPVKAPGVATGRSGSIGNVFFVEEDFWPLNTVLYVKDFHGNDPRFVFHLLKKFDLRRFASGAGVPTLNRNFVHDELVAVPRLSEQRRIVGILDEAFGGIAAAKANAEKNIQNARALFDSRLNYIFTQRGDEWMEKRLEDVCVLQRGFDLPTRLRVSGDFPLVSSSGIIDTHNEGPVEGPGVATGRSGSIGNVFYIEDDYWPLNTVLYVKQFHDNNPKFVYRLLSHFDLKRFASGAGVPTLNRNFVHGEMVLIPDSEAEQKAIAEQLDTLEQEVQRLESIYKRKLATLEALKMSLLHQAFTGNL